MLNSSGRLTIYHLKKYIYFDVRIFINYVNKLFLLNHINLSDLRTLLFLFQ